MKNAVRKALPLIDLALMPLVYPAGRLLGAIRAIGVHRLPRCRKMLLQIGVFPIRNHYYEPQFDHRQPAQDFSSDRALPGIDWNLEGQLAELQNMHYAGELADLPSRPTGDHSFHLDNGAFLSGDAEYWYQLIRARKPARIFEIGSGHSTLMARKAIAMNRAEDAGYSCRHVCIEPYEMPWLEQTGVSVVRKKVEDVAVSFFSELGENDILFIDSSHIIRPQGDAFIIKALTPVEDFNAYFKAELSDERADTIGGLVMMELGRLPKGGEAVNLGRFHFQVLRADNRRIHLLEMTLRDSEAATPSTVEPAV